MQVTASLGLLTAKQRVFAEKMSHIVIRESQEESEVSSDEGYIRMNTKNMEAFANRIIKSTNPVD